MTTNNPLEGILLVNKSKGCTSFSLVHLLRKLTGVKKIGHTGTLDPLATGVMVLLIGKKYTRLSDTFLNEDKEYVANIHLGVTTNTYDAEGETTSTSEIVPSQEEVFAVLQHFQGVVEQTPPMFSAKKIQGQKLYHLARKGKEVDRPKQKVFLETELLEYSYPTLTIRVACSKGTYIRTIANDIGQMLGCGAYLEELQRTRCGNFHLKDCINEEQLHNVNIQDFLRCNDANL